MSSHKLTDPGMAFNFVHGGNARFTLVSPRTGVRFTYRVRQGLDRQTNEKQDRYFVSLLTGHDNESDYSYIGMIDGCKEFRRTSGSKVSENSPSYIAFSWFFKKLREGKLLVEFWHEGRCARCGRTLTVPSSLETGFGPECINHV